jgi:Mg2+ and Co2+ transporter CorA
MLTGNDDIRSTLCVVPMRAQRSYSSLVPSLLRMPYSNIIDMNAVMRFLFDRHKPMFAWRTGTDAEPPDQQQTQLDQSLLTALLMTDRIRERVDSEEHVLRSLAYREPVGKHVLRFLAYREPLSDIQEEFTELAEFRRVLGYPNTATRDLRDFIMREDRFEDAVPRGSPSHEEDVAPVAGSSSKGSTSLHESLLLGVTKLEDQLDVIKKDINEEIQVAIGAVQVQDAQFMKQQTQETFRQTRLTVVLAILAALYLPLTLVTGIFGMNIEEISSDQTATYAWQVGVAWLVIFAFTATGGSAAYVWWEKRRTKKEQGKVKKKSDLEANHMSHEAGVKRMHKTDGRSSKRSRRWDQKAKQKTKTTRTAKRE